MNSAFVWRIIPKINAKREVYRKEGENAIVKRTARAGGDCRCNWMRERDAAIGEVELISGRASPFLFV